MQIEVSRRVPSIADFELGRRKRQLLFGGFARRDLDLELPFEILILSILVITLLRFGLLASTFAMFVANFTVNTFLTLDFEAWCGQSSAIVLIVVLGLALWGFKLSLGGRALFSPDVPLD